MEGVAVLLAAVDNAYLFFKNKEGLLEPPHGTIKINEGPKRAAARILKQTTGLDVPVSVFEEVGPCVYYVYYSVNWGPTSFKGDDIWLDKKELKEILRKEPGRFSKLAQEICKTSILGG